MKPLAELMCALLLPPLMVALFGVPASGDSVSNDIVDKSEPTLSTESTLDDSVIFLSLAVDVVAACCSDCLVMIGCGLVRAGVRPLRLVALAELLSPSKSAA